MSALDPLEDERWTRMAWARLSEPLDPVALDLVRDHGLERGLALVLRGGGARHPLAERFLRRLADFDLERDLHATEVMGARVVIPGDEEWPCRLDDLAVPPWCLWVRGPLHLGEASARSVSIVGARASTAYGEHLATDLAAGLVLRGFTIVSGAALGIDGAAHRGALATDGDTVAVLACGVDRAYPASHTGLIRQVREAGAVISEVPPGSAPTRTRFLSRNRIIAALSAGTIVVEASLRSGALKTARTADELHRPVGAVPGPVTSAVSAGCHDLVRVRDVTLVTDAAEVAELVGDLGVDLAPAKHGPVRAGDDLDEVTARVLTSIPHYASRTVDDLCRAAGLSPAEVAEALGRLELAGLVEHRLDGWGLTRRGVRRAG